MIYLEERERIQVAASGGTLNVVGKRGESEGGRGGRTKYSSSRIFAASGSGGRRFNDARQNKPTPLDDRLRELNRIYSGSASILTGRGSATKQQKGKLESSKAKNGGGSPASGGKGEPGQKRCECLGKHLLLK